MMEEARQLLDLQANRQLSESIFFLKRSQSTCPNMFIKVDFCPTLSPVQAESVPKDSELGVRSFPVVNSDHKFYTPCFILEADKEKYVQNDSIYFTLHDSKAAQLSEEKTELFLPKPSKNNSFCCICKDRFDDYLKHISSSNHLKLLRESKFCSEIAQLCSQFEGCKSIKSRTKPIRKVKPSTATKTNQLSKTKRQPSQNPCNSLTVKA